MSDVLVVGAGLLGASAAYHLARAGASVTVLDPGRPGSGTSGSSFAWINAQDKEPGEYFELNQRGLAAYPGLASTLGGGWFHPGGDLLIGRGARMDAVRDRARRHEALGYPVTIVDRAAIADLEPALRLPDEEILGAHFTSEAWIDAPEFIERLLKAAVDAGAVTVHGTAETLLRDGDRVVGVRRRGGTDQRADTVVLAAGPATEALAATAGVRLPMSPSPGLLVTMAPVSPTVRRVIHTGDVALRPDGSGRVLVASRSVDAGLDPATRSLGAFDPPVGDAVRRALDWLPGLDLAKPERVRIGIRSVSTDGRPAVGPAETAPGLYLLVSHSGATLAPILGELVAHELTSGPVEAFASYRPDRFGAAT